MDVSVRFLADLTIALTAATLLGALAARIRLNPIVGYLAAGIAIGRFTPGYVANTETVATLAQLGLIFLLFSLGLGFSFAEIAELGIAAIGGNAIATAAGAAVAGVTIALLAWPHPVTAAIATAVSSTAVGVALLRGWNVERELPGRFTIGQQIVQDLLAVGLLVVVTAPAAQLTAAGIAFPLLKAAAFVGAALLLGATVLQRFVRRVLRHGSSDVLLSVFSVFALVAAWLGYLAGLSFEFGAFVAGAVISEAAGSTMVSTVVAPFRALFVTLFFVSAGMLVDVGFFAAHWAPIVSLGLLLAAVRFGAWWTLARAAALTAGGAILVGAGMTALGEFNVVLITEAERAHRLMPAEMQALLGVTLVTILAAVLAGPALSRVRGPWTARTPVDGVAAPGPRVAIIGYGRVGETAGSVLRHAGIPYVALERNRMTVGRARDAGQNVVRGDASDPFALDRVRLPSVGAFLVTVPDAALAEAVTQRLRAQTEAVLVVRARRPSDVARLREHGASFVFVPESEGGLNFAAAALGALDVPPARIAEEIAAERERAAHVRGERPRQSL